MERCVYFVVSQTGTCFSRLLQLFNRAEYNHVSLSLDDSLDRLYSFGRQCLYFPLAAGFVREQPHYGIYCQSTGCRYGRANSGICTRASASLSSRNGGSATTSPACSRFRQVSPSTAAGILSVHSLSPMCWNKAACTFLTRTIHSSVRRISCGSPMQSWSIRDR